MNGLIEVDGVGAAHRDVGDGDLSLTQVAGVKAHFDNIARGHLPPVVAGGGNRRLDRSGRVNGYQNDLLRAQCHWQEQGEEHPSHSATPGKRNTWFRSQSNPHMPCGETNSTHPSPITTKLWTAGAANTVSVPSGRRR